MFGIRASSVNYNNLNYRRRHWSHDSRTVRKNRLAVLNIEASRRPGALRGRRLAWHRALIVRRAEQKANDSQTPRFISDSFPRDTTLTNDPRLPGAISLRRFYDDDKADEMGSLRQSRSKCSDWLLLIPISFPFVSRR